LATPRDDGEHTEQAFSSMEKLTAPLRCQPCGPLILHAPCGFTSHALIAQCGRTPAFGADDEEEDYWGCGGGQRVAY